jgi:hypothetical protein
VKETIGLIKTEGLNRKVMEKVEKTRYFFGMYSREITFNLANATLALLSLNDHQVE